MSPLVTSSLNLFKNEENYNTIHCIITTFYLPICRQVSVF